MLFFDSVSGDKIAFKNLNRYSIVLSFEAANSVLAHLAPVLHLKVHFQNFVSSQRTNKHKIFHWIWYKDRILLLKKIYIAP